MVAPMDGIGVSKASGVSEASVASAYALPLPPDDDGPAFEVRNPERLTCPLVFASPHSGRIYPSRMVAPRR